MSSKNILWICVVNFILFLIVRLLFRQVVSKDICNSTHRKLTVVGRLRFWVMAVQSQNMVQGWFWDCMYFGIFNTYSVRSWRVWCKNSISIWKQAFEMLLYTNTLPRFPNFESIFLKINFPPICYDVIKEIIISQECNIPFQNALHQNWPERTAI